MHLQIHVTTACEHSCQHCYYQSALELPDHMTWEIFSHVVDGAHGEWGEDLHVVLAGGNPLLWPKIEQAMRWLSHRRLSYGILGNPRTLIQKPEWLERLVAFEASFYQLSLEGMKDSTDRIRGKGTFNDSLTAIKRLVGFGIPVFVMATLHKENLDEIPELLSLLDGLGVTCFDCSPYVPLGEFDASYLPTPSQYRSFIRAYIEEAGRLKHMWVGLKDPMCYVFLNEAGAFLDSSCKILSRKCKVGKSLLAVETDGTIYPCRRLPLSLGTVAETSLVDALQLSRDFISTSKKCQECDFSFCEVGMPCVSHALGKGDAPYPLCWRQ